LHGSASTTTHNLHDIASFVVSRSLNSSEITACLKNAYIPPPSYDFPISIEGKRKRKFQYKYLLSFPWLAYSVIKQGAYCKWCVVFSTTGGNQVKSK